MLPTDDVSLCAAICRVLQSLVGNGAVQQNIWLFCWSFIVTLPLLRYYR